MRIRYVIAQQYPDSPNVRMYKMLHHQISSCNGVEIVDVSPDIVHVFGVWNMAFARCVEKYRRSGIPVIFTSANGGLGIFSGCKPTRNWFKTNAVSKICHSGTTVHVCGIFEKEAVTSICNSADTCIIANPSVTSTISTNVMIKNVMTLYKSSIANNDNKIRDRIQEIVVKANIADNTISEICSHILYIKQRLKMQNIPFNCLESTSRLLVASCYDESYMRTVLKKLHINKFASHVMALLNKRCNLTEGFMPLEPTNGRLDKRMESMIIQ